jgi:hypothetical protein
MKKSMLIWLFGMALLTGGVLAGCGDQSTGDPSGPPVEEDLGSIWILNQSDYNITVIGVNYTPAGYWTISISEKDPFEPGKIKTTGKVINAGGCTLLISDSSGYFCESPEFIMEADKNLDFLYDGKTIKKVVFTDNNGKPIH